MSLRSLFSFPHMKALKGVFSWMSGYLTMLDRERFFKSSVVFRVVMFHLLDSRKNVCMGGYFNCGWFCSCKYVSKSILISRMSIRNILLCF